MAEGGDTPRFVLYNDEEIRQNNEAQANKNSIKNEEKAVRCFKLFLNANQVEDNDILQYSDEDLDGWLAKFYWGARTEKGEKYSASTMTTMRYGLNRYLQKNGKAYDITKKEHKAFVKSINSFENMMRDLKKSGKGNVNNTPEICPEGTFIH